MGDTPGIRVPGEEKKLKRTRPQNGSFAGNVCFLVLLLALPTWRIAEYYRLAWSGDVPLEAQKFLAETKMTVEVGRLESSLRELRAELNSATRFDYQTGSAEWTGSGGSRDFRRDSRTNFRAFLTEVLPFDNPSSDRGALWLVAPAQGLTRDACVAFRSSLVGRLKQWPGAEMITTVRRVQTISDPGFRVRFHSGETRGILYGTGRRETAGEGRPLLEARHLTHPDSLVPGSPVVTAGDDGIYPPGVLIGWVVDETSDDVGKHFLVQAALSPEDVSQAVVLVNQLRYDWNHAGRRHAR